MNPAIPPLEHTSGERLIMYALYTYNNTNYPECPYILLKHVSTREMEEPEQDMDFFILVKDLMSINTLMTDNGFVILAPHKNDPPSIIMTYI